MPEPRSLVAAFLDRDGTIIEDRDYTSNPDHVVLLPGAIAGIRRLASAGYPSIAITNQSGIARGRISISQYHAVRRRVDELLRGEGVELRDTLVCPHHPDVTGPCDCRKPATGLYERAASVYDLDLSRCFYAGDRMRDIAAAPLFGGFAALVRSPATAQADLDFAAAMGAQVVDRLDEGVDSFLASVA